MDNPLVKKDLADAILELRAEVERRLLQNKYYVAMTKLDELLAAIRPLDIIEGEANPSPEPKALDKAAEPAALAAESAAPAAEMPEVQASWHPAAPSYGTEAQAGLSAAPAEAAANGLGAA